MRFSILTAVLALFAFAVAAVADGPHTVRASAEKYGNGFGVDGGKAPLLDISGDPTLGDVQYLWIGFADDPAISGGKVGNGAMVIGFQATDVPFLGGALLVVPARVFPLFIPAGGLLVPLVFPADPLLAGQLFYLQAFQRLPIGVAGSNGLALRLGVF